MFFSTDVDIDIILNKITLLNFDRKKLGGGVQEFFFHIKYENKEYTLIHKFRYHYSGVTHKFKFKKRFFESKPFYLNHMQYIKLSDSLMKIVNTMTKVS